MVSELKAGWTYNKLNELGFVGRGKSKHRPRNAPSLYGGVYPFIQTGEVKAADMYISNFSQTYNEKGLAQSKLWEPETLLITIAANIAETAILKIKACFPDSIVGFIADPQKADVRFIKYYIGTIKLGMQNVSKGTTQDNLSLDKLLSFQILTPPLDSQQKIASILSAYDDLIENNLKRIKILEEMAQMIYREWFVNFRFPGHEKVKMVKSELGMIPEGWEIIKLGEMLEFQKGKKAKNIYHQPLNNSIPYLLIDGLRNRSFLYTDDKTMPIAKKDDILMVMDGASSGQVFIGFEGAVGSTIGIYRIKDTKNLFSYLVYFFLKNNFKTISEKNIGSAIPHANKDFIASMKIVTPKSNIVILFSDFVSDIFKQIDVLERKTLNLRKTRDLLLPKLISGEIDVGRLVVKTELRREQDE